MATAAAPAYIGVLDDEMPPLVVGEHRQDVLARFPVALPHQEVALLPQQLLRLGPGNGAVVPLLLRQGALRRRDDVKELLRGGGKRRESHDGGGA